MRKNWLVGGAVALVLVLVLGAVFGISRIARPGDEARAERAASESAAASSAATQAAPSRQGRPPLATTGESFAELSSDPAQDQAYRAYYEQTVDWSACEGDYADFQCGSVTVPKHWNDPAAGDITLALLRIPASGEKQGTLFLNPGGPGGSGVDFVGMQGPEVVGESVAARYDLIGFDPRGVGDSTPLDCVSDARLDEMLAATYDPLTPEGLEQTKSTARELGEGCRSSDPELIGAVDTLSAARDLDVLRAVVGSDALDYLGYSYGTYLGATYAELYPQRVGRMVLDGALDPTIDGDQLSDGQARGFENAIGEFAQYCLDQGSEVCPLNGDHDQAVQQVRDFFSAVDDQPLETTDPQRPLTGALARSGVLVGLYADESWDFLIQALGAAMSGDGTQLLFFADAGSSRQDDGTYLGNSNEVISAVNCLDHPSAADEAWSVQEAERLAAEYPTFGGMFGFSGVYCAQWPAAPVREPAPIRAEGAAPIVVIGTTGDPATPYEWAESLSEQLTSGTLVTFDGNGHTAYGRSGGCVEEAVDAYLLEGTVPEDGLVCSGS
ncbi:alpha/beta fold hydrolase [Brachybacterium sp. EF45031]|uniref:alpha/beta hydrolase n=1 Tax=Brachybacterium sillae TaxID=2810536 RepID=UPI00217EDBB7|nr:alpha/beta hydrolase [Brachybacterium sillae]MCS6712216.1 alpha/beta fold hydrolase [Brachybacterium sillae]